MKRVEDQRLLRGQGGFVANQAHAQALHAVFVRSQHAHARITGLQLDAARALPGVRAVLGPKDFTGLLQPRVNLLMPGMHLPRAELVPVDRVLAVGAPVVLVLADSLSQAQAAADAVWIDCAELPAVADFDLDAASIYAAVPGNLALHTGSQHGQLPTTAATAQVQIELPRVAASPLEPRAALMQWDAPAQQLTAWLSTQTPSRAREELAQALGLRDEQVRVLATDVGGAFGGKASLFAEDLMLAHAAYHLNDVTGGEPAKPLRRPLRWLATRGEDLVAGTHGRASRLRGGLWMDAQGGVQALAADLQFALGHWLTFSAAAPIRNASRILPGPYQVPAFEVHAEGRLSNAAAVGIYRGAGRPEACILMERLMDEAAHRLGLDPLAVRLANVWPAHALPRVLPQGEWLDRCDLAGLLECAALRFDYPARRARQLAAREVAARQPALTSAQTHGTHAAPGGQPLIGLGMALYIEPCGQGAESVRLTALADGRYALATGATAQGQGRETAFALIAGQALSCAPELIEVRHGDTALCPPGIGALASRSTAIGGSAVLAAVAQLQAELAAGAALPCTVEVNHQPEHEAWASGCVMLELHIDRATGQPCIVDVVWIDDAGVVVSPDLVRGQLIGGLAQGIGQAMMERVVYDAAGQLQTGSLMDYAMPRADDMPPVHIESLPTRSAANRLGAKGVGEAGCIGLPAALLNAACDALRPLGQVQLDFPLTAARLWQAMRDAAPDAATKFAAPTVAPLSPTSA